MNRLYGGIGLVWKNEDGLLVAINNNKGLFVQCKDGTLVPIISSSILLAWVDGPEAAYVESMERLGLATTVVFDFGEDCYRISTALAQWRNQDTAGTAEPGADTLRGVEAPF